MTVHASTWLSSGAEVLVDTLDKHAGDPVDCDLLIVGSGYGGAVAAARMAVGNATESQRNTRIWLVERGREYLLGMFPSRFSELPGHVRFSRQDGHPPRGYAEALFDLRIGEDAHVLLGNGLGGGSLINAGVMVEPDPDVLRDGWPFATTELAANFDKVRKMLEPQSVPEFPSKLKAFRDLAGDSVSPCPVAVRFSGGVSSESRIAMKSCTGCGDCLTGCNHGAKATLDTNYLAYAVQRGVEIFCGVSVTRLLPPLTVDGPWRVCCHYTEPSIRPSDGKAFEIRAQRVILAAGALGSTEILLRSRSTELGFSPLLGRQFSTNGDMIAAVLAQSDGVNATADQEIDPSDPGGRKVGPTITGLARVKAPGSVPITVEEFAVPGALSHVFGEIVSTFGIAGFDSEIVGAANGVNGEEPLSATGAVLENSALYGMMGDDEAAGRIELPESADAAEAGVRIRWPDLGRHRVFDAQMEWLKSTFKGQPEKVIPNPTWRTLVTPDGEFGAPLTVHPLGGCPMGKSAAGGVVNEYGLVFRPGDGLHDRLAVLDGSIVPKALCVNPALTIAALAERACEHLCGFWGLGPDTDQDQPRIDDRPRWSDRRPVPREATCVRLRESLQGLIELNGTSYWARLDLESADIDLTRILMASDKTVALKSASLALFIADDADDEFSRVGKGQLAASLSLTGELKLFIPIKDSERRSLVYDLAVDGTTQGAASVMPIGTSVRGLKHVALKRGSPWRHLSEMDLFVGAELMRVGRLSLDMEDLARRREALLTVRRQSSAPDGLADVIGLGLLVLRIILIGVPEALARPAGDYSEELIIKNLMERRPPEELYGRRCQRHCVGDSGAQLTHYRPQVPQGQPVMLIHGFGASGSTFSHPSIPISLAEYLLSKDRDVWILDLRTSIANEPEPGQARPTWTFEEVALGDIPPALNFIRDATGQQVDVVAHCIGAAMFCVAVLDDASAHRCVGAAVLSQVGPLLRMSPANRLRGYLASYLEQFIGAEDFDVRPEYKRVRSEDGSCTWQRDPQAARFMRMLDLLLGTYPYPDDDKESEVAERIGVDFRTARHRCDAIWGHLMEAANVADKTWQHLEAINGWVKVRSFAQTIHYARHGLLIDATGRNSALRQERLETHMSFPILIVHGQRNRVFDWRGSLECFQRLHQLRFDHPAGDPVDGGETLLWGSDSLQLLVAKRYGHQDCIVGRRADQAIFEPISSFLDAQKPAKAVAAPKPLPIELEVPWIGPVLGSVAAGQGNWIVKVLVRPHPRRSRTVGLVIVPLVKEHVCVDLARGVVPDTPSGIIGSDKDGADDLSVDRTAALLTHSIPLTLDAGAVPSSFDRFLVLTIHSDLRLQPGDVFEAAPAAAAEHAVPMSLALTKEADWLLRGSRLAKPLQEAVQQYLADSGGVPPTPILRISHAVCAAASTTLQSPRALRFAVASCQYPPGLLDAVAAGASYARLQGDCNGDQPPQFMLALGDQVYVDAAAGIFDAGASGRPADGLRQAYELNWRLGSFRRVASALPIYPMLDDHEVRDNWQPGKADDEQAQLALDAFARFQRTLAPQPFIEDSWHYRFAPCGANVFVMDTRTQRTRRRVASHGDGLDVREARIVPDDAIDKLCHELESLPPQSAKIIASPSVLLPLEVFDAERPEERLRSDGWSGFPASMQRLLKFIREKRIQRVLLLSGDAHGSVATKVVFDNGVTVCAVMSSGLHAPWPFANSREQEFHLNGPFEFGTGQARLNGEVSSSTFSHRPGYALVSLDGPSEDPHRSLHVSLRHSTGGSIECHLDWGTGPVQSAAVD